MLTVENFRIWIFSRYYFFIIQQSSLPLDNIDSKLSRSFRGVVTDSMLAKLMTRHLAAMAIIVSFNDTMLVLKSS